MKAIALTLAGIAALAALVLAIDPLRDAVGDALSGDTGALREDLRGLGVEGALILGVLILVHTFVWYPTEIVNAAAGFVYGFWLALALGMVGWTLQGMLAYVIGRKAARPLLYSFIGERRFVRVERGIATGGVSLLLAARLVPIVPFSLFSYVAGATRVPFGRFAWTTAIGYIPITALFVYFGTRLEGIELTDPVVIVVIGGCLALLALTHRLRGLFGDPQRESV